MSKKGTKKHGKTPTLKRLVEKIHVKPYKKGDLVLFDGFIHKCLATK